MKLNFDLSGLLRPSVPPPQEHRPATNLDAKDAAKALLRAEGGFEPDADRFSMAAGLRLLLRQRWPFEATKVICCIGKGGAGKSTATLQFAVIAAHQDLNVLVLDCDRQRSVSGWARVRGEDSNITVRTCSYNEVERVCREARREGFDLVLVDHPQQPTEGWPGLARATDLFLLLSRPSIFDLTTARAWLRHLGAQKAAHLVVISSAPPRRAMMDNPAVRDARDVLATRTACIWGGQITSRQSVIMATARGKGVIELERLGPGSAEYIVLWHRVCGLLKKERKS